MRGPDEPRATGYVGGFYQEARLSIGGGGPGGLEFEVYVDADGAKLAVWNPFRNEWAEVKLEGLGSQRV